MADTSSNDAVRVTAEERPHIALQKLARALIALARLRQAEAQKNTADQPPEADTDRPQLGDTEASHE